MERNERTIRRWDALWLLALVAYILAGSPIVPFHGDESTLIYMGRDAYYQFVLDDWEQVFYSENPTSLTEQHLRLLNGTIPKYLYGLTAISSGYAFEEINEQWNWGLNWEQNINEGRKPLDDLLLRTRLISAAFLAGGAVILFLMVAQLAGRPAAYIASLYFALNPVLLVNGRRAMMEGGMIFFMLLVLWVGLWLIEKKHRWVFLALGISSGLAVATKHPAVIGVAVVFIACQLVILLERKQILKRTAFLVGAGIVSLIVFYALNPAWWGDPIGRIPIMLELRSNLLADQTAFFGGYETFADRIGGMLHHVFIALPQYYEVSDWGAWIADEINRYESSPLRGVSIGGSLIGALLLIAVCAVGVMYLTSMGWQKRLLLALYFLLIPLAILVTNPLDWQRYYLPIYPVIALVVGLGTAQIMQWVQARRPDLNQPVSQPIV